MEHKKRRRGPAACWLLDVGEGLPTAARMVHTSAMRYRSVLIEHFAADADGSFRLEAAGRPVRSVTGDVHHPPAPAKPSERLRVLVIKSPIYVARQSLIDRLRAALMAGEPLCASSRADDFVLDANPSASCIAHRPVQRQPANQSNVFLQDPSRHRSCGRH